MSRIGKKAVSIPDGVTVNIDGQEVKVKGVKGELSIVLNQDVSAQLNDGFISVMPRVHSRRGRAMWGLSRTLVSNIIRGVSDGFSKTLDISGVGYRAQVNGNILQLNMGYSHDVSYLIPSGVNIVCPKPTEITISGIEAQRVGQISAEIRSVRPPEPYKGKGICYRDEYIFRKEGKKK